MIQRDIKSIQEKGEIEELYEQGQEIERERCVCFN